jgi:hypothetical protein
LNAPSIEGDSLDPVSSSELAEAGGEAVIDGPTFCNVEIFRLMPELVRNAVAILLRDQFVLRHPEERDNDGDFLAFSVWRRTSSILTGIPRFEFAFGQQAGSKGSSPSSMVAM